MTQFARLTAPSAGLDLVSSQEATAATAAPDITNLLVHKSGKLVQRGPLFSYATLPGGQATTIAPTGYWTFNDVALLTMVDTTVTSKQVTVTFATDGTLSVSATTASASIPRPAGSSCRVGSFAYGIAADNTIWQWDGSTGFLKLATGPSHPIDVAAFRSRVVVLGGQSPGPTGAIYKDRLWWSDPGGPTADTVDMWKDDVSGLVNQIVLPDDGVGLASLGDVLVVLCKGSVQVVTGTAPSNWQLRQALQLECVGPYCVVEDVVYFLTTTGIYSFDGVNARKISTAVEPNVIRSRGVSIDGSLAAVGNGYLLALVYDATTSSGRPYIRAPDGTVQSTAAARFFGLYHMASGTWTHLSTDAATIDSKTLIGSWGNHAFIVDGTAAGRIYRADELGSSVPDSTVDQDGAPVAVPVSWATRSVRLANPFTKAVIRRIVVDWMVREGGSDNPILTYSIKTSPSDAGAPSELAGGGLTTTDAPTVVASGTLNSDGKATRRRSSVEVHAEVENVWVEIRSTADVASKYVELYDVWVEYDQAQQSRGY